MAAVAELGLLGSGPYTGDFSDAPTQQEMRDYQEQLRQAMLR